MRNLLSDIQRAPVYRTAAQERYLSLLIIIFTRQAASLEENHKKTKQASKFKGRRKTTKEPSWPWGRNRTTKQALLLVASKPQENQAARLVNLTNHAMRQTKKKKKTIDS